MRRATWVWTRPDPGDLVGWAVRARVGELFVAVGPGPAEPGEEAWLRELVRRAHVASIRVSALGGHVSWIDRPEEARAWVRALVGTGIFDGVHLDLEPWAREDWDECRDELVTAYLDVLRRLAGLCPLPLEADLTHWLHTVPTGSGARLDVTVMKIVDAVTVLSFRRLPTGPDSITEVGAPTLLAAGRLGIPCRLALETNDLGPDPGMARQTFHGLGADALDAAIDAVDGLQRSVPAYHGVAVHDLEGWVDLAAQRVPARE